MLIFIFAVDTLFTTCGFQRSSEQLLLALVPPTSLYVKEAGWLRNPVKFYDSVKMLSIGDG